MADSVNKFCYKILDSVTDFAAAADGCAAADGSELLQFETDDQVAGLDGLIKSSGTFLVRLYIMWLVIYLV